VKIYWIEIQIGWGEDTRCDDCQHDLPAGAPAWTDVTDTLCNTCVALRTSASGATL
jgi:hypothetical protein